MISAFVVIVIGGIGSVRGAFIGAVLVGLVDTFGRAVLPEILNLFLDPSTAAAALAARGVPTAALSALVPTVIGFMCLPWSNPLHAGRETRQQRDESE